MACSFFLRLLERKVSMGAALAPVLTSSLPSFVRDWCAACNETVVSQAFLAKPPKSLLPSGVRGRNKANEHGRMK